MTTLHDWACHWAVPQAALSDLCNRLGMLDSIPDPFGGGSEAAVQARVRVRASKLGMRVWRNNVGAFHDAERGVHVRFGLANDSPAINRTLKSADLIGIRPRVIGPNDVGTLIGQFVSYEVKHAGWKYAGTEREIAQANWAALVSSLGGEARFVTSEGDL